MMHEWKLRNSDDQNSNLRLCRNLDNSMKLKYEESWLSILNSHTYGENGLAFPHAYQSQRSQVYRSVQLDFPQMASVRENLEPEVKLQEEEENQDAELRKGLRYLALRVSQLLRNLESASYRQVSNMLVEQLVPPKLSHSSRHKEQKNIKRRVYDALNVLISVGVIEKKSKRISIREQLTVGKCLTSNSWDTLKTMQKKYDEVNRSLQYRTAHMKTVLKKYLALRKLRQQNKRSEKPDKLIKFPVLMIRTPGKQVKVYQSQCHRSLAICSTNKISIRSDFDIIKEAVSVEQEELNLLIEEFGWIL